MIYSTRENIKSTLVIFLKYKKSVLWVNFFVVLLTLLTQFAATYLPGWIVDLLTGENAGTQTFPVFMYRQTAEEKGWAGCCF